MTRWTLWSNNGNWWLGSCVSFQIFSDKKIYFSAGLRVWTWSTFPLHLWWGWLSSCTWHTSSWWNGQQCPGPEPHPSTGQLPLCSLHAAEEGDTYWKCHDKENPTLARFHLNDFHECKLLILNLIDLSLYGKELDECGCAVNGRVDVFQGAAGLVYEVKMLR